MRTPLPSFALLLVFVASTLLAAERTAAFSLAEVPNLLDAVRSGRSPPVYQRVPHTPSTVDFKDSSKTPGRHGGELRLLMGKARDIRMLVVYGYARLVGYDEQFNLVPDILERFEEKGSRVFTFHLRPGHRWSDGQPFTTADFRYFWEDIANDKDLSPFGPTQTLLVDGEAPRVEIIDETTIRYSWSKPNPFFLPALAGARPLFI